MPYDEQGYFHRIGWSETGNASARRGKEFFDKYLKNKTIIDIGCGFDPITENSLQYDVQVNEYYDATYMKEIPNNFFDVVYASHVLEHVSDIYIAFKNWWRILKTGGTLIVCIPDRDAYEMKRELPSNWNKEHKCFFLSDYEELPFTINYEKFVKSALFEEKYEIEYIQLFDGDIYDELPIHHDENHPIPEYQIESVIRKNKVV